MLGKWLQETILICFKKHKKKQNMNTEKTIKVIEVHSQFEVILNCGTEDGQFYNGQQCQIYGLGNILKDPDSEEDLEALEIIRGLGKITHIQGKISTVECSEFTVPPIIKKTTFNAYGSGTTEETQPPKEKKPFKKVQLGDLVRFIK